MKKESIYNKLEELQDAIKDFDLAYETDLDERVYKQESIKFKLSVLVDDIDDLMYKENIFKKLFKKGVK